jgi:hypothetical protein
MHATRSWAFEQYLRRQPLERRLQLIAAEKEYSANHGARLSALEQVFWECMQGYEDTNEGAAVALIPSGLPKELRGGDWSWKPLRNSKFAQFEMPAFTGVPPSAAELYGRMSYSPA